jgi:hypothetical protein
MIFLIAIFAIISKMEMLSSFGEEERGNEACGLADRSNQAEENGNQPCFLLKAEMEASYKVAVT